jgi:hypothetical protein
VLSAPVTELPEKLYIDEARMALNGVSSFQFRRTFEGAIPGEAGSEVFWVSAGTYVQSVLAWRASVWFSAENASGTPATELLTVGERKWQAAGGTETWFPSFMKREEMDMYSAFGSWTYWGDTDKPGRLLVGEARTIDGVPCRVYSFPYEGQMTSGEPVTGERFLFLAVDSLVPMGLETRLLVGPEEFPALVDTLELSHIDDPGNVVEAPE